MLPCRRCATASWWRFRRRPSTDWALTRGHPVALRRVFELKGRPLSHPLIVHMDSRALPARAGRAKCRRPRRSSPRRFWPGPLTMVLPRASNVHAAGHRRPGYHGRSGTFASHGAAAADRFRRRHRRALGQPLRPPESDARRACARGIRRCGAPRARWRGIQDRTRVDHRGLPGRQRAAAAAGLDHCLSSCAAWSARCSPARCRMGRALRAASAPITRPRRRCRSSPRARSSSSPARCRPRTAHRGAGAARAAARPPVRDLDQCRCAGRSYAHDLYAHLRALDRSACAAYPGAGRARGRALGRGARPADARRGGQCG